TGTSERTFDEIPAVLHAIADARVRIELVVQVPDASVNDVDLHARSVQTVVVAAVQWKVALINAVQAPAERVGWLAADGLDEAVLFDELDERVVRHGQRLCLRHFCGESVQRVAPDV